MVSIRAEAASRPTLRLLLFATALAVSSFLMFMAEPMVARAVLPTLGGSPMVWTTCVVFFQVMLLAGYAYAHASHVWLTPRWYAASYALLVLLPLFTLPLRMPTASYPPANPVGWLLLALVRSVGVPFFVLSTSASVLQKLFAVANRRDPYFLYITSNTGSLLALLSYPTLLEPLLRLQGQRLLWTFLYALFALLVIVVMLVVRRSVAKETETFSRPMGSPAEVFFPASDVSWWTRAKWTALSFIPSSLMLGVTRYLSTDIAAVPLLWVIPLALYLVTFILAFGSHGNRLRGMADRWLPLLVVPVALFMTARVEVAISLTIGLHLLTFLAASLVCHCELASSRPSPSALTDFYLWIAVGGTLGGIFNTLVAPFLFKDIFEYPLLLVLACLARAVRPSRASRVQYSMGELAIPAVVGGLTAALLVAGRRAVDGNTGALLGSLAIPGLLSFSRSRRPVQFAGCIAAVLLAGVLVGNQYGRVEYTERTFFGVHRVSVDGSNRYRSLFDGTTLHGMEAVDPAHRNEPLTYYHRTGPFGEAFSRLPHVSGTSEIAVIGLGVGSLASYADSVQRWTFYELDPAVERIARSYFTFLDGCGNRCRVVLGDARLSLADAPPNAYSVIVLDAFSSDALPIHLLTVEALSLYLSRLAPDGVLSFHISNRHLSISPVLGRLAQNAGLIARLRRQAPTPEDEVTGRRASEWMVMARRQDDLGALAADSRWLAPSLSSSTPLWTDDFSSILPVLSLRRR